MLLVIGVGTGVGGGGGGGAPGLCAPPSFHKLLYKLLTTLCAAQTMPPQSKVFPTPLLVGHQMEYQ